MARPDPDHVIVIGAGAAGLMAAREFVRAGKKVTRTAFSTTSCNPQRLRSSFEQADLRRIARSGGDERPRRGGGEK